VLKNTSLIKQGLPKPLTSYITQHVCGIQAGQLVIQVIVSSGVSANLETALDIAFKADADREGEDWATAFVKAIEAAGASCNDGAIATVRKFLDDTPDEKLGRLRLSTDEESEYAKGAWVPKLKLHPTHADGLSMEAVDSFGAPYLLASRFVGMRMHLGDFPFACNGGLMMGKSGCYALLLVDMTSLWDDYGNVDGWETLMDSFTVDEAVAWMQAHSQTLKLEAIWMRVIIVAGSALCGLLVFKFRKLAFKHLICIGFLVF
jgi:hypothetical protein